ncbi:isoprenoid biosynthesis glyoxalase ElbB [Vibrio tritonius]|uniref:Glyoxalase n=1 Tax=Vibrio tritonius TaxID=1435069 RepID=A0ABS7YKS1_9VIBR|nr:isoprenoid biosynthesis glyoxalase ElbB [Vibrio tritonius]MCA2016246.1 isoprenoid biosynthesis glyoxalase ElbB [Vibrio tritonius]
MKKVAVILSGCGVFDGAEIHESVLTLLAIEKNGATWHCFAPNVNQHHVLNHITGEEMEETRNVLVESARISRGKIDDVAKLKAHDFDALIIPGGFGAAKNLSDFAFKGADCVLHEDVAKACRSFAKAGKPAAYLCIAPHLIPKIYESGVEGTIGNDKETAAAFNKMGGQHINCPVDDFVYDQEHNLLSTPAYMLAENISQAESGINRLVTKLISLA